MCACLCKDTDSRKTVNLNNVKEDLAELRDNRLFPEREFPEERILDLPSGGTAVAVGSIDGNVGGLIVPVFGLAFRFAWEFERFKFASAEEFDILLKLKLFSNSPKNVIKKWEFTSKCSLSEGCSFTKEETNERELFCGIDDRAGKPVPFSAAYHAKQSSCESSCSGEENRFDWLGCLVSCAMFG